MLSIYRHNIKKKNEEEKKEKKERKERRYVFLVLL